MLLQKAVHSVWLMSKRWMQVPGRKEGRKEGFPQTPGSNNGSPSASRNVKKVAGECQITRPCHLFKARIVLCSVIQKELQTHSHVGHF